MGACVAWAEFGQVRWGDFGLTEPEKRVTEPENFEYRTQGFGGFWEFAALECGREGAVWVEVGSGGVAMVRHVVPGYSLLWRGGESGVRAGVVCG